MSIFISKSQFLLIHILSLLPHLQPTPLIIVIMAVSLFIAVMICQIYLSSKQLNCDTKMYLLIILGTSIFTILPVTQYVYVNDTVTFECATNLTGYILFFESNAPVTESLEILPNGGRIISFNLIATIQVNGTSATCRATNGAATEPAYMYVQGQY